MCTDNACNDGLDVALQLQDPDYQQDACYTCEYIEEDSGSVSGCYQFLLSLPICIACVIIITNQAKTFCWQFESYKILSIWNYIYSDVPRVL